MHNLFNQTFYSHRVKPWHQLGVVSEEARGAVEAFNLVEPFSVSLEPLYTEINGQKLELAQRAILRHPTPSSPEFKSLGIVGPDYHLLDPLTICEIYDQSVNRPVETLGALGEGETLFLSTLMPKFDVRGDEVDNYLLIVSPYSGNSAIQLRLTPVRVVCTNTLIAAKAQTTESYRIVHNEVAKEKLGIWMSGIMTAFEQKTVELASSFDLMAGHHIPDEDLDPLLGLIYVDPKPFGRSVIPAENARRQAWFEENLATVRRRRQAVKEVFGGKGVGQDTRAAHGTVWGLYNAVAEYEAYRPNRSTTSAAADFLTGARAGVVEVAYDSLFAYAIR